MGQNSLYELSWPHIQIMRSPEMFVPDLQSSLQCSRFIISIFFPYLLSSILHLTNELKKKYTRQILYIMQKTLGSESKSTLISIKQFVYLSIFRVSQEMGYILHFQTLSYFDTNGLYNIVGQSNEKLWTIGDNAINRLHRLHSQWSQFIPKSGNKSFDIAVKSC